MVGGEYIQHTRQLERCRRFCSRSDRLPLVDYDQKAQNSGSSSFKGLLVVDRELCCSKVGPIFEDDSADLAVTRCDIGQSTGTYYVAAQRALYSLPESFAVMGGLTTSSERLPSDGSLHYSTRGLTGRGSSPVPRNLR